MKVVCINDNCICEAHVPLLIKGNTYTVIDSGHVEKYTSKGKRAESGTYYKLVETNCWYHSSLFVQINEIQQDEEELIEQRNNSPKIKTTTP